MFVIPLDADATRHRINVRNAHLIGINLGWRASDLIAYASSCLCSEFGNKFVDGDWNDLGDLFRCNERALSTISIGPKP